MARTFLGSVKGAFMGGRLPGVVRETLALERAERILAHAPTSGGSHVVATTTALYVPAARGAGTAFVRLPWERIEHATWQDDRLHVRESQGRGEYLIGLAEPGSIPETVRERVTSTIVVDQPARLPGGGRVRITGRRRPGGDGLRWTFVFEAGLDPTDPELQAQAERLLTELRRQTGL